MSRRGRRSEYKNFSVAVQILLCSVTEAILPLGRDYWEQVALRYNARRPRGTDFDALRRKF
ncbi:hypothetical protein DVH05_024932 [Phytophthora capsici]|nr:hypothetical protein DVH05_024932 [Phytophthora capsici]